jgi:hypothetical protein
VSTPQAEQSACGVSSSNTTSCVQELDSGQEFASFASPPDESDESESGPAVKLERTAVTQHRLAKIRRERTLAAAKQQEGFESAEIFKLSVEARLAPFALSDIWWRNFQRCGREEVWIMCADCQRTQQRKFQCNNRWCPRCNWRVSERRRKFLEKLTNGMTNVKHVVLTQRNFLTLTHQVIQKSRGNLLKLRRRLITSRVFGGCASLEFTNENTGWHMHWHLLLHTRFICANCLAFEWGQLCSQSYAIVKVLPVHNRSYVQEVCKYAVKGSEIARWSGHQIKDFVEAQRKIRMFSVFGSFAKVASLARAAVEAERVRPDPCVCGCHQLIVGTSEQMCQRIWNAQFH